MDPILIKYHAEFITEIRRRLVTESRDRLRICLHILKDDEIWYRPNENSNSVGNLILHLCGNVRQWLFSGLGGEPDRRERQKEFDSREFVSATDLWHEVNALLDKADQYLVNLTPEQLLTTYHVQGFRETGIAILIHITEHFSYHVGQITYFVKMHTNRDTGYYSGQDLNIIT